MVYISCKNNIKDLDKFVSFLGKLTYIIDSIFDGLEIHLVDNKQKIHKTNFKGESISEEQLKGFDESGFIGSFQSIMQNALVNEKVRKVISFPILSNIFAQFYYLILSVKENESGIYMENPEGEKTYIYSIENNILKAHHAIGFEYDLESNVIRCHKTGILYKLIKHLSDHKAVVFGVNNRAYKITSTGLKINCNLLDSVSIRISDEFLPGALMDMMKQSVVSESLLKFSTIKSFFDVSSLEMVRDIHRMALLGTYMSNEEVEDWINIGLLPHIFHDSNGIHVTTVVFKKGN